MSGHVQWGEFDKLGDSIIADKVTNKTHREQLNRDELNANGYRVRPIRASEKHRSENLSYQYRWKHGFTLDVILSRYPKFADLLKKSSTRTMKSQIPGTPYGWMCDFVLSVYKMFPEIPEDTSMPFSE